MRRSFFVLLALLAGGQASYAQAALEVAAAPPVAAAQASPPDNNLRTFFTAPEVVLPKLYEAAIAHSGEIARLDAMHSVAEADVKLARKRLLNMLALTGSYTYGTLPYFATAETSASPVYQANPFNLGARAQFSTGVGLALPLDLLATRRTTIMRQEYVVDQAAAQRRTQEAAIRQVVIVQYQALALARATQQNAQEALQSANVSRQIADRRFKQGEIQVDDQMAAMDYYSKAQLGYEEARNKYQTAQLLLEDLIGMPITSISLAAK
ncbi:TolC family protein [Hymenobacter cheonanensis]|uniref:TolC family protein n=1 Tax=Hymenobacter sp. CA2-7 TaxID=3063993 RepID=UPI0027129824|nr:TolC family protein [Hymenobacter sp. CA2-7]MDO7887389.1 TolC family protein [Hymenobacter sp. CA2-7]